MTAKPSCARSTRSCAGRLNQTVDALRLVDRRRRACWCWPRSAASSGIAAIRPIRPRRGARPCSTRSTSLESGNRNSATAQIDALAESDSAGYRAAALFARANAQIAGEQRQRPRSRRLGAIAADESLDEPYRQAALVRQTAARVRQLPAAAGDPAPVAARAAGPALVRHRRRDGRRRPSAHEPARSGRPALRPDRPRRDGAGLDPHPRHPDGRLARRQCAARAAGAAGAGADRRSARAAPGRRRSRRQCGPARSRRAQGNTQ